MAELAKIPSRSGSIQGKLDVFCFLIISLWKFIGKALAVVRGVVIFGRLWSKTNAKVRFR